MKCSKCGTELGQKNVCPVCGPKTEKKSPSIVSEQPSSPIFGKEEMAKIDEFVKANLKTWNDEFDSFYDEQVFAAGYKETVEICRRRAEIFDAIYGMLKGTQKLSADLIIQIMEEIPEKYPEISDYQARAWAKEFFCEAKKQIRPVSLKDAILVSDLKIGAFALSKDTVKDTVSNIGRKWSDETILSQMTFSVSNWSCKENAMVRTGDPLCSIQVLGENIGRLLATAFVPIWGPMFAAIEANKKLILKSPYNGKIKAIYSRPTKLDDIICEIETAD